MDNKTCEVVASEKEAFDLREQAQVIMQKIKRMKIEINELQDQAQLLLLNAAIVEMKAPALTSRKGQMVGNKVA